MNVNSDTANMADMADMAECGKQRQLDNGEDSGLFSCTSGSMSSNHSSSSDPVSSTADTDSDTKSKNEDRCNQQPTPSDCYSVSSGIERISLQDKSTSPSSTATTNLTLVSLLNFIRVHKFAHSKVIETAKMLSVSALRRGRELLWDTQDEDGDFEVLNAARDEDDVIVTLGVCICESAKKLNTKNEDWQTVLHVAAELCSPETVRLLITRGADGAIPDRWGNTALHIAAREGRADVAKELTTRLEKEEMSHEYYRVPFKSLPQDNKDQMNHDGRTPIHLAVQGGFAHCIHALSKAKVDLDVRRLGDGYAPLHIAIDNGDIDSMRALLECGADLEVRNHKGETPQQLAYLVGRTDMVELCVDFGVSPNQLNFAETEQIDWSSDEEEMDCEI